MNCGGQLKKLKRVARDYGGHFEKILKQSARCIHVDFLQISACKMSHATSNPLLSKMT